MFLHVSLKPYLNYSKMFIFDVVQFIVLFQLKCLIFELACHMLCIYSLVVNLSNTEGTIPTRTGRICFDGFKNVKCKFCVCS